MDHRVPLKVHSRISLGGTDCHIEALVGMGSNAIVYKAWYSDALTEDKRHHVLIKELFPFHPGRKIWRDDEGRIVVESEAQELWETHRESFEAGNRAHLSLLEAEPELMALGANLNSFAQNATLYSMLGYSGGRSMQADINARPPALRQTVLRMLALLDALEAFHRSGYLHLDISPDNIMLVGEGKGERCFLIDYNSAIALGTENIAYLSCKPGYSAPELTAGRRERIGQASDLYSVAAVFYRCLMGRRLSLMDALRPSAPDGRESPLLGDAPQTVRHMASAILKKGLDTLPSRRYGSIAEMRQDFAELLDRIDCVGVTHWALWENGRRQLHELTGRNPALRYLRDKKGLYPMRLSCADGESRDFDGFLEALLHKGGSALLLGQGGIGKTSALLHAGLRLSQRYSPLSPAVFYLSLSAWNGRDSHYIEKQILMSLRFRSEENRFNDALHALHRIFAQPLKGRDGEGCAVLLLLDGLNEIRHDVTALLSEIRELAAMDGVAVLAASRSEINFPESEVAELMPLDTEDVENALGARGLLAPPSGELLGLMRTPLMLSLYIEACSAGTVANIESAEQLMGAYMEALLKKAEAELPEDSPVLWQLDAALNLVLPAVAAKALELGGRLSEEQLLKVIKGCRKDLGRSYTRKIFPRWTGHISHILGGCSSDEEWYGLMVHSLLWQRLGMLLKYEDGYGVFHQELCEYLAKKHLPIKKAACRRQGLTLSAVAALFVALILALRPRSYDEAAVESAMELTGSALSSYTASLRPLNAQLPALLYGDTDYFLEDYELISENMDAASETMPDAEECQLSLEAMLSSGHMMPHSKESFAGETAAELTEFVNKSQDVYLEYMPLLRAWAESTAARTRVPDLPVCLKNMIESDRLLVGKLFYESFHDHLYGEATDTEALSWAKRLEALVMNGDIFVLEGGDIDQLRERQQNSLQDFYISAVSVLHVLGEEGVEPPVSPAILAAPQGEDIELRQQAAEELAACLEYYDTLISRSLWALDYVEDFVEHNSWDSLLKARTACTLAADNFIPDIAPQPRLSKEDFAGLIGRCLEDKLSDGELTEDYISSAALAYDNSYYHYSLYDSFSMTALLQLLECDVYRNATLPLLETMVEQCRMSLEKLSAGLCARSNALLYAIGDQRLWYELPSSYPSVAEGMGRWISDAKALAKAESAIDRDYYLGRNSGIEIVNLWSIAAGERAKFMAYLEEGRTEEAYVCLNHIFDAPTYVPAPPWLWERLLPGSTGAADGVVDMFDFDPDPAHLPIYYHDFNKRYYSGQLLQDVPEGLVFTVEAVEYEEIEAYEKTLRSMGFEVKEKEHLLDWEYCRRISRGDYLMEISWCEFACVVDISANCCFVPEACIELFN